MCGPVGGGAIDPAPTVRVKVATGSPRFRSIGRSGSHAGGISPSGLLGKMAMYTKMTAAGSSLVVLPRSISKELEAKIAASIARVMAAHDVAALSTKIVRQAVEKDVHVSLANHKDVLKRLMHQEFRKIKAQKVARRAAPEPWKLAPRSEAVIKALRQAYALATASPQAFHDCALHATQALYELQTVETGPVLKLAALYARLLGARWLREQRHQHWEPQHVPSPSQLVEAIFAVYVVEGLGICHPRRVELLNWLERSPPLYTAMDFLGWDPATSGPPASDDSSSVYERFTDALLLWFYTNYLGQSIGFSLLQLLQYLPALYPYKAPDEVPASAYRTQIKWIVSFVMILTEFGRLRCEPELLPHEYFFLRQHLVYQIAQQDVELVGDILQALKCFEGSDNLVAVRRGMAFLLSTQDADGSWTSAASPSTPSYPPTMSALRALSEPRRFGFAPAIPDVALLLEQHLNSDFGIPPVVPELPASPRKDEKRSDNPNDNISSTSDGVGSKEDMKATEPASSADLETQVRFQQSLLENDGDNVKNVSAKLALHVLATLSGLKLTVDILKSTGIGRTINKLRKHANAEVAKAAGLLVAKWKKDLL